MCMRERERERERERIILIGPAHDFHLQCVSRSICSVLFGQRQLHSRIALENWFLVTGFGRCALRITEFV